MRQLALLGLVFSLLLGGTAVFETSETAERRRGNEDRSLQAAVGNEVALISGGERQTTTALSLMLIDPAVRQLLSDPALAPGSRHSDLTASAQSLATIKSSSFVPLTAACLD